MAAVLVSYDLNSEVRRPNIVKAIKDVSDGWAKLSESSYAINTSKSAETIYNQLKHLIDSNDQIYIIPLKKPWFGFGPTEINDWLDRNLSY